jgi:hypothetical protein
VPLSPNKTCERLWTLPRSTIQRLGSGTNPLARWVKPWQARYGKLIRVGAIGEQFCEERKLAEQRGEQPDATVAILNTSRMNDRVQKWTLHIAAG